MRCSNTLYKPVHLVQQDGDEIQPGDVLCDIETDKATIAFEAQVRAPTRSVCLPCPALPWRQEQAEP